MRVRPEPASDEDSETRFDRSIVVRSSNRNHAGIVEHRLTAIRLAAREVDLELPRQALSQWVSNEMIIGGFCPGADVEHLVGARSCQVAPLNVPDGVAAGFASTETNRAEMAHHLGDLLQLHVVHLDVLPGCDVAPLPRIVLCDETKHVELVGGDRPIWHAHADHLVTSALSLPVDPIRQPEDAKHILVYVT